MIPATYYKFLTKDNRGQYSKFDFTKYLPTGDKPGKWLPKVDKLILCESGYHACQKKDIFDWFNINMFEVELRGETITAGDKIISQEIRFIRKIDTYNDRMLRHFACWCAEQVLPIFEKERPNDDRPRNTIAVARLFADGKVGIRELNDASIASMYAGRDAIKGAGAYACYCAASAAANCADWLTISEVVRNTAECAVRAEEANANVGRETWNEAYNAARQSQIRKFMEMVGIEEAK